MSFPRKLYGSAIEVVDGQGFGTFSGYLAFLIRMDLERRRVKLT